jgi:hypothetical protein
MTLTAGTTLQNGKYVIQATIEQNDFGATYTATQVFLDQAVLLQTLSDIPSDGPKAAKLQEQFLEGVRHLAKRRHAYPGKVLDYFVEGYAPFVVLEAVDGKTPPSVQDWLPSLVPKSPDNNLAPTTPATPEPVDAPRPSVPIVEHQPESERQPDATSTAPAPQPVLSVEDQALLADVAAASTNHQNGSAETGQLKTKVVAPASPQGVSNGRLPQHSVKVLSQAKRKSKAWLPLSLVMTSVIAGVAGASFGWAVRFENLGSTGGKPIPLLSNEQDFPNQDNWPIRETPNMRSSEPIWEGSTGDRPTIRNTPSEYDPIPAAEPLPDDKAVRSEDFLPDVAPIPDNPDPVTSDVPPLPEIKRAPTASSPNPAPDAGSSAPPQDPGFLPAPVPEPSIVTPAPAPDTSSVKPADVTVQ